MLITEEHARASVETIEMRDKVTRRTLARVVRVRREVSRDEFEVRAELLRDEACGGEC
jgi:hypothetical protein